MDERGSGFVHLNTPSSISYTKGQTVSLSDLSRRRTRVDCVALPPALMTPWRQAVKRYASAEGYQPFAADAEAERMGNGPVLPALSAPLRKPAEPFFRGGAARAGRPTAEATTATAASPTAEGGDHPTAAPNGGITIVSHHRITGVREFVYPDHDGVLSGGVVPEVVVTDTELAEKEATRAFYISPLMMSPEELDAFEELQMLWRSRARSHSALGAQHRQLAGGTLPPGPDGGGGGEDRDNKMGHDHGRKRPRDHDSGGSKREAAALWEEEAKVDDVTEAMLTEALRMADDLLQLS